jgi:cell division initiation protein
MKITPLDIRQKTFQKVLRGYEKEEVQAFLDNLSREWEKLIDENKEYKIRYEQAEKELRKLREVEDSLVSTLKTAQDTSAQLEDNAKRNAELEIKKAQVRVDSLLNEARWQAKSIIEESESKAKRIYQQLEEDIKSLERQYNQLYDQRNSLIEELRNFASEILDKANRASKMYQEKPTFIAPQFIPPSVAYQQSKMTNAPQPTNIETPAQENEDEKGASFFDSI